MRPGATVTRLLAALLLVALAPAAAADDFGGDTGRNMSTYAYGDGLREWDDAKFYGAERVPDRDRSEFHPDGIEAGTYLIMPSLESAIVYDDNIFQSKDERVGDMRYELAPELVMHSRMPRHMLDFMLGGRIVRFQDNEDQSYEDGYANVDWRIDIDAGDMVGGSLLTVYDHEDRLSPETPLGAAETVPVWSNRAKIAYKHDLGRLSLTLGADAASVDYMDVSTFGGTTLDQDYRDFTSYGSYLRLGYRLSPGVTTFAAIRADRQDYLRHTDDERDSLLYRGRAGFNFEITPLLRVALSGGYGYKEYDRADLDSFGSMLYEGSLEWLPSPLLTLQLSVGQELAETTEVGSSGRLDTRIKLKADYELMRNLVLSADLEYVDSEFEGTPRSDGVFRGRLAAEYLYSKNLMFTFAYEHQERDSTDDRFDLDDNRYTVGATVRF